MDDQQMQAMIQAAIQTALAPMREDVSGLKTEMKSTWKRIDEQRQLAESVHELALSVRDLTNAQKNSTDAITELRRDVDELQSKPAKRWESVVGVVVTVIVTAVVTYAIAAAGLK